MGYGESKEKFLSVCSRRGANPFASRPVESSDMETLARILFFVKEMSSASFQNPRRLTESTAQTARAAVRRRLQRTIQMNY